MSENFVEPMRRLQLLEEISKLPEVPLDDIIDCIMDKDPIISLAGAYYYRKHVVKMQVNDVII